jgi:hypothetical protein
VSSSRRFAREIEARWSTLLERPVILGERDWQLISDWHERGIPLGLVSEAMEALGEKLARRRRKPRNLGALAPLVEEAWQTVREGRIDDSAPSSDAPASPAQAWRRCADSLALDAPLKNLVETLLAELGAGADPGTCDQTLDRKLPGLLAPSLLEELTTAVEANLADFRPRWTADVWKASVERALISAARRRLNLPYLGQ